MQHGIVVHVSNRLDPRACVTRAHEDVCDDLGVTASPQNENSLHLIHCRL